MTDALAASCGKAEIPAYTCTHHRWEYWNHYGQRMPESGCGLSKRRFGCPYKDASKCPDYQRKGDQK